MPAETPLRAVAFDLDGLMFNTEDLYQQVGTEILRRRGKLFEAELLDAMMGRPSPIALQIMIDYHDLDATVAQLEAETDAIFASILDEQLRPMPGLVALLDALEAAKIPKAIATSSRRGFAHNVLSQYGWVGRFEFILTSEDITNGKPDPEIYLQAAQRFDLSPPQMLVLEDSQNGCQAAVAAGTYAVAVPAGHSRTHRFDGAALIAESLEDRRIYDALCLQC